LWYCLVKRAFLSQIMERTGFVNTFWKHIHLKRKPIGRGLVEHLFLLGLGLALFGLLIHLGGVESLRQLVHLRPIPLIGALLATLGITSAIAWRWGTLANALGGDRVAAWPDYFHYFIVGRALGFVLPKDIIDLGSRTVWLNHQHSLALPKASASVALDRLSDVLTFLVFLLAALPFWLGWVQAPVGIGLMLGMATLVGGLLFVVHRPLVAGAGWLLNRGLRLVNQMPWLRRRSLETLDVTGLDRGMVLRVYLFGLVKFGFTAARLVLFAMALSLPISPTLILLGTPLGQLSYLFAFTPGGLGIFEAGWFAILILGGVAAGHATTFVVGQRVLTMALIAILVLCSQILFTLRRRSSVVGS
jgi:uncharacterized membrane protein YbhN (UPF0104 family)